MNPSRGHNAASETESRPGTTNKLQTATHLAQFLERQFSDFGRGEDDVVVPLQGLLHLHAHQGVEAQVSQGRIGVDGADVLETYKQEIP